MPEARKRPERQQPISARTPVSGVTDQEQTVNQSGVSEDIDSQVFQEMGQWSEEPNA